MRELVWDEERMRDRVLAARGETLPALVLKNAQGGQRVYGGDRAGRRGD